MNAGSSGGVFTLDGFLNSLGPLTDSFLELCNDFWVLVDLVIVLDKGGDLGDVNCNVSVGLLEAGGDLG